MEKWLLVAAECGPVQGCILYWQLVWLKSGCACLVKPSLFTKGGTLHPSQKCLAEKLTVLFSVTTIPAVSAGAMSCQLLMHKNKKQDLRHFMSISEQGTNHLGL